MHSSCEPRGVLGAPRRQSTHISLSSGSWAMPAATVIPSTENKCNTPSLADATRDHQHAVWTGRQLHQDDSSKECLPHSWVDGTLLFAGATAPCRLRIDLPCLLEPKIVCRFVPSMCIGTGLLEKALGQPNWLHLICSKYIGAGLVGTPAQQLRAVAGAVTSDVVKSHFNHEFGPHRLPGPATFGAPAAGSARRFAGESRRLPQRFQPPGQRGSFLVAGSSR
jgi:hypothetical protein